MSSDRAERFVRESLQEVEEGKNHVDLIAWELECLWDEFDDARQKAINGVWSIGCESKLFRIVVLTRFLGRATDWGSVPYRVLLDGTYTRVHEAMGIEPQPFDVEEVRQAWENYLGRNLA